MTICGDLEAMMASKHGGQMTDYAETVASVFDFLQCADVISFLSGSPVMDEHGAVGWYLDAVSVLRGKCVRAKRES